MLPKVDSQSPSMLKKKNCKTNFLCLSGILIWIKAIGVINSVLIRNIGALKENKVWSSINVLFLEGYIWRGSFDFSYPILDRRKCIRPESNPENSKWEKRIGCSWQLPLWYLISSTRQTKTNLFQIGWLR